MPTAKQTVTENYAPRSRPAERFRPQFYHAVPSQLVDREEYLLAMCTGKRVLHLGCTDSPYTEQQIASGAWLHSKVLKVAKECVGVDMDADAIAELTQRYGIDNLYAGDAEHLGPLGEFDVILAGELIEHLRNPGLFFAGAAKLLPIGGQLLVTTPNAFCLRHTLRLLSGIEVVHPDHNFYYSHTTLRHLAESFGFTFVEGYTCRTPSSQASMKAWLGDRLATLLCANWGEGLIHKYTRQHD